MIKCKKRSIMLPEIESVRGGQPVAHAIPHSQQLNKRASSDAFFISATGSGTATRTGNYLGVATKLGVVL